jgi:predicted kinase
MLIIVCGLPGSGKSTLARALSKRRGAVHLSSDLIRKRLFPRPSYSEEEKSMVYQEMAETCRKALSGGRDVVADATFYRESARERFLSLARETGARSIVILCSLREGEVRRRLGRRVRGGPSDADFGVYMKMKAAFEPIRGEHLEVDTALPLRKRLAIVDAYLGEGRG